MVNCYNSGMAETPKSINMLLEVIENPQKLKEKLGEMHPGDLAELIERLDDDQKIKVFRALNPETASETILEVNDENRQAILEEMTTSQITEVVEEMESDDAADFVSELPEKQAEEVLSELPSEESEEVRVLLQYPEDSAGGIMQLELVSLTANQTCHDAIEAIRAKAEEVEELHNVFVTDDSNMLLGVAPLRNLILNSADTPMEKVMESNPIAVNVNEGQEKVAQIFRKYDVVSLPVVDDGNRLIGRILHDDVLDVIVETDTEDLLKVAGTDEDELESGSWLNAARYRLPWLLSSLMGGIFMAGIISAMGAPLKQAIALAAFIPVITGMSGNVSTQSSAIVLRGIVLGKMDGIGIGRFIYKEIRVGLVMGSLCGILIGVIASFINENPTIGLVVGVSLFISMSAATVMGTGIPLILHKLKADPVLGAGPVVLTMADIAGLLIYFTVATILLKTIV